MTPRVLAALAFALVAGCKARFDPEVPRPYRCSTKGSDECPDAWVCNLTAGFCINPDAGLAVACSTDDECGGGWRCSPNRQCVDRSVEGQLRTLAPLGALALVSPNLPRTGALHTSQPIMRLRPDGYELSTDVFFDTRARDAGLSGWLRVDDTVTSEGTQTLYDYSDFAAGPWAVVTTRQGPDGVVHSSWSLEDGGLVVNSFRGQLRMTARRDDDFTALGVLRSGPLAGSPDLRGSALVSTRGATWVTPSELDAGFALPPASDVALAPPGCAWRYASVADGGLTLFLADGGTVAGGSRVEELRVAGGALGWRTADDTIWWAEPCRAGALDQVNSLAACPPDAGLDSWTLIEKTLGAVPVRFCSNDAGQRVVEGNRAPRFIYDRLEVSTEGTMSWARAASSNAVTRFTPDGVQGDVTLAGVPDAVFRLPGAGAAKVATRNGMLYGATGVGFLLAQTWVDPSSAIATGDGRFMVFRNGVVLAETWAVAFAPTPWAALGAPVLMRKLALNDGGILLAVTHDDLVDVVQLKVASRSAVELAPTVAPLPGLAVKDLALSLVNDGGFATGYAIAGGSLVALTATTPTHWQAARVNLPLDALHVWFDGPLPRAVMSDGTVLGLSATVALTPPTPAPAIAATTLCGSPLVLTEAALYQLADGGWAAVPGVPSGLAGGSLRSLEGQVYVFDGVGHAWLGGPGACP